MSRSSNSDIIKHLRGAGIPDDWHEGEIAIDTQNNVLACCVSSDGTGKAIGLITSSTTPSDTAYHNTLWLDTNSTSTGIPASYQVANNLTTSSSGTYVLDAYQGKALNDAINAQNTVISALSVDYIIEESSIEIDSTTFYYRKWNSGFLEIWGNPTISFEASTSIGGFYRSLGTLSMSSICLELYSVNVNYISGGIFTGCINGTTASTAEIARWTATSVSATSQTIKLFMTGRWK